MGRKGKAPGTGWKRPVAGILSSGFALVALLGLSSYRPRGGNDWAGPVGHRLAAAKVPLAAVVTSPLLRCTQTLRLALPDAVPEAEPRLVEAGYGDWEGQPLKTLAKQPLWQVVQAHPSAARFPGAAGESMAEMSARLGTDAVWLACSHGDVIKAIVADALGMHLDLFQRVVVDPGSLTVIRYTPLRPFLLTANDTGGDLSGLRPPRRRSRRRAAAASSDAVVGGGAGPDDRQGVAGTERIGSKA